MQRDYVSDGREHSGCASGDAGDKPGPAEFCERGVALLSMLLPAFKAGVRDIVRYSQQRESLTSHLDHLTTGIRICDFDGSTVHQNPAFTNAVSADETPQRLEQAIQEIVVTLVELSGERSDIGAALAGRIARAAFARHAVV